MKSCPQIDRSARDTRLMLFLASALATSSDEAWEACAQRMQSELNASRTTVPAGRASHVTASDARQPDVHIKRPGDTGDYRDSAMVGWKPLR